jgi:hypothetical protein
MSPHTGPLLSNSWMPMHGDRMACMNRQHHDEVLHDDKERKEHPCHARAVLELLARFGTSRL